MIRFSKERLTSGSRINRVGVNGDVGGVVLSSDHSEEDCHDGDERGDEHDA